MSGRAYERERLCTFLRNRGNEEVRWSLDEFAGDNGENTQFAQGRIWARGRDGEFRPTKSGITIRLSELDEVVAALQRVQRTRAKHDDADAPATNKPTSESARRAASTERQARNNGGATKPALTDEEQLEVF